MENGPKCKMKNYKTKDNIGENLDDLRYGDDFLDTKTQFLREIIE